MNPEQFDRHETMEGKLFITEGPDACGKTTFSKHLATELGGLYWHMTCTRLLAPAMADYQLNAVENAKVNMDFGSHVVFDRLWPSEACYGPVLRPGTMIDPTPIRHAISKLDPVYIFCLDSAPGIEGARRASARHQRHLDPAHPYDEETYLRVYMNYWELYQSMRADPYFKDRIVLRPFDENIVEQAAIDKLNDVFIDAMMKKFNV